MENNLKKRVSEVLLKLPCHFVLSDDDALEILHSFVLKEVKKAEVKSRLNCISSLIIDDFKKSNKV